MFPDNIFFTDKLNAIYILINYKTPQNKINDTQLPNNNLHNI